MIAFILIVSLVTPTAEVKESTDRYESKAACIAAADDVKAAMAAEPKGYKLRSVECAPAPLT